MAGHNAEDTSALVRISLLSKIAQLLENHLGVGDKTLAEFLLDICASSRSLDEFSSQLHEAGAPLPPQLCSSLFRLISTMNGSTGGGDALGGSAHAHKSAAAANHNNSEEDQKAARFQGLAMQNTTNQTYKMQQDMLEEAERARAQKATNDLFEEMNNSQAAFSSHNNDVDTVSAYPPAAKKARYNNDTYSGSELAYPPPSAIPRRTPQVGDVWKGRVTNVVAYGAFVALEGDTSQPPNSTGSKPPEGLCHISQLEDRRVSDVKEVVNVGDIIYVKIIGMENRRISLSRKEVDQLTGVDLNPSGDGGSRGGRSSFKQHDNNFPPPPSRMQQQQHQPQPPTSSTRRAAKKLSDHEMWEAQQLINSGVLKVQDYPTFDNENPEDGGLLGASAALEETGEEFEVDIREDEPAFLKGQTTLSVEMSPIKIVKNPDGSLQRAAMAQGALAKDRREAKEQEERAAVADHMPTDLARPWEDPMRDPKDNLLAEYVRSGAASAAAAATDGMPEWKKAAYGKAPTFGKRTAGVSISDQRKTLPVFALRDALIDAVNQNDMLVVIGETGSGKTTQITQYLAEFGYTSGGRVIGCTQPRRVAAMSVAKRVAEEYGCRLGEEVGYAIRFEDMTGPSTVIKYMTDGMLLREILLDEALHKYSVLMLDEAHERTIHTDILFGLLKAAVVKRKGGMKLIVTSATLDAEKFSAYFNSCPIFTIPGRTFPVDIMYTKEPESDYLDAALVTVMQVHLTEPEGDILLFLTGMEEIDTACEILYNRMKSLGKNVPELIVLPVYSALPNEMQTRIFDPAPPGTRKCVIATNIAEASLTIDGIYYVVDPGFAKQKVYNPKLGMDSLVVSPISQASAKQRSGRAGRTGPGKCYRLFTEVAFKNEMLPLAVPEIQRSNLGTTVLQLKAMGINDLIGFDFMDPPPTQTLVEALASLYHLGALDEEGLLTRLGRKMAEFPLEPPMAKVLIASVDMQCADEILTVVSMLTAQNIFFRPKEKQHQADQARAKFLQPEGDHMTLLAVYESWKRNKFAGPWCRENYIQLRSMKRAQDVRKQLLGIMDRYSLDVTSAGRNYDLIRKAITSGFFYHVAKRDPTEGYKTIVEQQPVHIHPSSALFQRQPDWVLYHELVLTTKEYMRECLAVEARWLTELAPRFFKSADPTKLSRRKRQERIEPLFNPHAAHKDEWRLSRRKG